MELKLDMSKITKVVMKKDENTFIEYYLDNGVIDNVEIIKREKTVEEKVKELKSNPDVQKVSKLIELSDKAGVLTKMVNGKYTSITDAIKDSVKNEPITVESAVKIALNKDTEYKLNSTAKESAEIMKMDEKMDEIAKEKREEIAEKMFSEQEDDEKNIGKKDAIERIKLIKETINKRNKQDE